MSVTSIVYTNVIEGVPTDADGVVLTDADGAFGVRRVDTGDVVVSAGVAMTHIGAGSYSATFVSVAGAEYEYVVKVITGEDVSYYPRTVTAADETTPVYATLASLKARLKIDPSDTTNDALLEDMLQIASRAVDVFCARQFYSSVGTRYYDSRFGCRFSVPDDVVSIDSLSTDSEGDQTFDGETWLEGSDFICSPANSSPKLEIHALPNGRYWFADARRYIKIVGTFGYGSIPASVQHWVLWDAAEMYGDFVRGSHGLTQERQGDYFYARREEAQYAAHRMRVLGPFVRWSI